MSTFVSGNYYFFSEKKILIELHQAVKLTNYEKVESILKENKSKKINITLTELMY